MHDCKNCPNNGSCRKEHDEDGSMLTLSRRAAPPAPPVYTPWTPGPAPQLARAYARQCVTPSAAGDVVLHDIAVALVARLKDVGVPPERVIVAIKAAIRRYSDCDVPSLIDEDIAPEVRSVYTRLFGWVIDAYFAEPV